MRVSCAAALVVVASTVVLLTGCSSSGSPHGLAGPRAGSNGGGGGTAAGNGGGAGAAPGAITFHATVSVTGAYTFTDAYDTTFDPDEYNGDDSSPPAAVPSSCSDIARLGTSASDSGRPPSFSVPSPEDEAGTLASGKNSLQFQADVDSYTGPKTYSGQEIDSSSGMEVSNTPTLPEDGGGDANFGDAPSKSSVTVNPDGSGRLLIVGWEDAGSRTVSATINWTCSKK